MIYLRSRTDHSGTTNPYFEFQQFSNCLAITMSEAAVVGEGTEVNKGENARMASFVGALAIGE